LYLRKLIRVQPALSGAGLTCKSYHPYKPAIIWKLADGTNRLIGYEQAVSSENIPGPERAKKKQRS